MALLRNMQFFIENYNDCKSPTKAFNYSQQFFLAIQSVNKKWLHDIYLLFLSLCIIGRHFFFMLFISYHSTFEASRRCSTFVRLSSREMDLLFLTLHFITRVCSRYVWKRRGDEGIQTLDPWRRETFYLKNKPTRPRRP